MNRADLSAGVLLISDEIVEQLVAERRALTDDEDDDDDDHHEGEVLLSLVLRRVATRQVTLQQPASSSHQLLDIRNMLIFNGIFSRWKFAENSA